MQKLSHVGVVVVFAVTGVSSLLEAAGAAWRLATINGPYFRSELGILEVAAFLLAAVGLYRYDSRIHKLAIFLGALTVLALGLGSIVAPGIVPVLGFVVWLLVLFWLLSSQVRERFGAQRPQAETN